jgi:WD40 repeat protein
VRAEMLSRRRLMVAAAMAVVARPSAAQDTRGDRVMKADARGLSSIAWSPDGRRLAAGGTDGVVRVWDAISGEMVRARQVHNEEALGLAWTPDGRRIVSGGTDLTVHILDAEDLSVAGQVMMEGAISSLGALPSGMIAAAAHDGTVAIIDPLRAAVVQSIATRTGCQAMAISPDGRQLACGNPLRLIDISNGTAIERQTGARAVHAIAFAPDMSFIASTHWNGQLRLWRPGHPDAVRILTATETYRVAGPDNAMPTPLSQPMTGLAIAPGGDVIAAASIDRKIRFWNATTGDILYQTDRWGSPAAAMAYSPDGVRLAVADLAGAVRLLSVAADGLPSSFPGQA